MQAEDEGTSIQLWNFICPDDGVDAVALISKRRRVNASLNLKDCDPSGQMSDKCLRLVSN